LNFPEFQGDLFPIDVNESRLVHKTLRKLRGMDWEDIRGTAGEFTVRLSHGNQAVV